MNIMSDKLEKKFNEIFALLATTQTPAIPSSPTRKVARGGEFITCQEMLTTNKLVEISTSPPMMWGTASQRKAFTEEG
jgi:hypothetical protein